MKSSKRPKYQRIIRVMCLKCGVDYDEQRVKVEDISEDVYGRDVLQFVCPKGHECKSLRVG